MSLSQVHSRTKTHAPIGANLAELRKDTIKKASKIQFMQMKTSNGTAAGGPGPGSESDKLKKSSAAQPQAIPEVVIPEVVLPSSDEDDFTPSQVL